MKRIHRRATDHESPPRGIGPVPDERDPPGTKAGIVPTWSTLAARLASRWPAHPRCARTPTESLGLSDVRDRSSSQSKVAVVRTTSPGTNRAAMSMRTSLI
jgi:hypothetical protein